MDNRDPIIVSAVRTPIGGFGGSLRDVSHTEMAAKVMEEVCRQASYPKDKIDDIYWGVVMPRSDENGLARSAALKAGIPEYVSAVQVNRACCSSMEAIRIASMAIRLGEADAILAGGGESMSNVSYSIKKARWGLRLNHHELSDGVWDGLKDHHTGLIMGLTAENVAEKYNISREDQDEFAHTSQMRTKKALEEGNVLPPLEVGEILAKGPRMMTGYWKDEKKTSKVMSKDGWLRTADKGWMDEDGYIYLAGRGDDMIIRGGENISPEEVENVILSHPGVEEVAVIGIPDPEWGQEPRAVIVLKKGKDATGDDIIDYCRSRLAGFKRPRSVIFLESLPRNAMGKVLKKELREKYGQS